MRGKDIRNFKNARKKYFFLKLVAVRVMAAAENWLNTPFYISYFSPVSTLPVSVFNSDPPVE